MAQTLVGLGLPQVGFGRPNIITSICRCKRRLTLSFSLLPRCHLPTAMEDELATELAASAHSESLWHKTGGSTEVGFGGIEG